MKYLLNSITIRNDLKKPFRNFYADRYKQVLVADVVKSFPHLALKYDSNW